MGQNKVMQIGTKQSDAICEKRKASLNLLDITRNVFPIVHRAAVAVPIPPLVVVLETHVTARLHSLAPQISALTVTRHAAAVVTEPRTKPALRAVLPVPVPRTLWGSVG